MNASQKRVAAPSKTNKLLRKAYSQRTLFFMVIPCIILVAIFYCGPMYGWLMALVNYKPKLGVFGSEFVGLSTLSSSSVILPSAGSSATPLP